MTAAVAPVTLTSGDTPVRHALRRLWGYIRANDWYYVGCTLVTLAYAGTFVAVPKLLGWAVTGAVEGVPRADVLQRCGALLGVALWQVVSRLTG